MIYLTADSHFGHHNILKYCNRPFQNVNEMDAHLIDQINKLVKPEDTLYHLGDFCFWNKQIDPKIYRERIKCKNIHLILGNHDYKNKSYYLNSGLFKSVGDMGRIAYGDGSEVVLCHYAMRVWNKSHHGVAHAYGHSHGTLKDDPCSRSMDVGVDNIPGYKPISYVEFWEIMKSKEFTPIDHHGA